MLTRLLENWDLGPVRTIEPIESFSGKVTRVRTPAGHGFILKEKTDRRNAEREAALLARLAEAGAPVAVPLNTVTGGAFAQDGSKIYLLSPELSGTPFSEHYAGRRIARAELMGKAIAGLHACLLKADRPADFPDFQVMEHIHEWALPIIRQYPKEVNVSSLESAWGSVAEQMGPIYGHLPIQLIHRDAHPGNILFDGNRLTGFIDFDLVVRGPRIFDLGYCGTSLLMAAYPAETKMQAWPKVLTGLVRGYQGTNPLSAAEKQALRGTMVAIELIYVALGLHIRAESVSKANERLVYWLMAEWEAGFQNHLFS